MGAIVQANRGCKMRW